MRKIQPSPDSPAIFIFQTAEEREEFFERAAKNINDSQAKSLSDLRSAYMSISVKARKVRAKKGKMDAKELFGSINSKYAEQVKKTHDLYAKSRGNLRAACETSLLESEIQPIETPPPPGFFDRLFDALRSLFSTFRRIFSNSAE